MSYEAFHDDLRDTRFALNHGSGKMPAVGFGTLFKDLGVTDLFITTKLWNTNHRPERVLPAFEASCRRLQLDYIDCYLIHTPFAFQAGDDQDPRDVFGHVLYDSGVTLIDTWRALEQLVDQGRCRAIGLSDITLEALKELVAVARIKPAVLAFAPLGHGMEPNVLQDEVICGIARHLQRTPAQVALAWAVQRGVAFLTTSATPGHVQENFAITALPHRAMLEIREEITTRIRFNSVVETGVPGFIPRKN